MTPDEWLSIAVGDVVSLLGGPERIVLTVKRVQPSNGWGRCGGVRTCIRVPQTKSPKRTTLWISTEDIHGHKFWFLRKGDWQERAFVRKARELQMFIDWPRKDMPHLDF